MVELSGRRDAGTAARVGRWRRLALPLAALTLIGTAEAGVLTVDDTGTARNGKVGHFSSMVVSGDEIAVSYYCEQDPSGPLATSYAVRFAWKAGDCWQVTNLGDFGSYNSLKRDSTGRYHICYAGWDGLVWAHGGGRNWTIVPGRVDSGVSSGELSMALDSADHPHVAYFDSAAAGGRALRYTYWDGAQWMRGPAEVIAGNVWTPTISPGNNFLALDTSGRPHVAFAQPSDAINSWGDIRYASLQGGAWTIESLGVTGADPSLVIGSDNVPRIAFQSVGGLTYAYKAGGQWVFEAVTTGSENAGSVTLVLGPGNAPTIGFAMTASEDLFVATRSAGGWFVVMVDGDGLPNGDLLLGRLGIGMGIDPLGRPHMSCWAVTIYDVPGGYTDHRSDLRYYTPGDTGTICPEVAGACCDVATGGCEISLPSACAGQWKAAGACSPEVCNPTGACCDAVTNACAMMAQSDCAGGAWSAAASCQPDPCDPAVACCDAVTHACAVLPVSQCTGTWTGASSCLPDPCDPVGACCDQATGACATTVSASCAGSWTVSASCTPNPCPQPGQVGACCEGTECVVATAEDCDHGSYQGPGTVCGPDGNPTTCCPANFNGVSGVTVQDIFDFLAAYFVSNPAADMNASGNITVQDIFDYLTAYFAGCS